MFVCVHVFIDSEIQINGFSYTSPSLLPAMACLGLLSCAFVMTEITSYLYDADDLGAVWKCWGARD